MRQKRLKTSPDSPVSYYHCVSRVVDRQFLFGDAEKARFIQFMRLYETFCGVRVVTHCMMSNHFHILLEIPQRPADFQLSDEELLTRLKPVNSSLEINTLRQKLELLRQAKSPQADAEVEALKAVILARMYDLSAFMKMLKGRFSQWYNRSHQRKGTLWEERFKSVLVEAAGPALMTMAAYIDLNPVRAGLVDDPKDYRWSGYGEANGGSLAAAQGLQIVVHAREQIHGGETARSIIQADEVLAAYRTLVYDKGLEGAPDEDGQPVRRGFTEAEIAKVLADKGKLTHWQMLHCRVRYFTDGAVIGSKGFLKEIFTTERSRFGPKRKIASHPMRGVDAGDLRSLRDLRLKPIG